MKSEGVRDVFVWLEQKCKEQKIVVDKARGTLQAEKEYYGNFDDTQCIIEDARVTLEKAEERLRTYVDIKISVEKYMKKLRHQGQ